MHCYLTCLQNLSCIYIPLHDESNVIMNACYDGWLSSASCQQCGSSPLYPDAGRNPQLSKKVVGGWEARPGEFPYQVKITFWCMLDGVWHRGRKMCLDVWIDGRWLNVSANDFSPSLAPERRSLIQQIYIWQKPPCFCRISSVACVQNDNPNATGANLITIFKMFLYAQALLLYFGSAFCGGFLIDANTVLTAAHCTAGE